MRYRFWIAGSLVQVMQYINHSISHLWVHTTSYTYIKTTSCLLNTGPSEMGIGTSRVERKNVGFQLPQYQGWCQTFFFNSLRLSDAYVCQYTNHNWFRLWLVGWSALSHYLNQCWNIVNCAPRNQLQWRKSLSNVLWKMATILSQPQCVIWQTDCLLDAYCSHVRTQSRQSDAYLYQTLCQICINNSFFSEGSCT